MADQEAAVLDAPVVETVETPATEITESTETTETTEKTETKEEGKEATEVKPAVNAELSARAQSAVDKVGELFDALKKYAGTNVLSKTAEDEIAEVKTLLSEVADGKTSAEVTAAQTKEVAALKTKVTTLEAANNKPLSERISELRTADPENYWKTIGAPAFKESLHSSKLVEAVSALVDAFNNKDNKVLGATLQSVVNYLDKLDETPAAESKTETVDPKTIEQRDAIIAETYASARTIFTKLVTPLFKTNSALKALDAAGKQEFSVALQREYQAQFKSDAALNSKLNKLWKGDLTKTKAELLSTHNEKLKKIAQDVIDKVIKTRYPKSVTASVKSPLDGKPQIEVIIGGQKVKATKIDSKPKTEAIDMAKTTSLDLINHRAMLKSGRAVAWQQYIPDTRNKK